MLHEATTVTKTIPRKGIPIMTTLLKVGPIMDIRLPLAPTTMATAQLGAICHYLKMATGAHGTLMSGGPTATFPGGIGAGVAPEVRG
jgi:hypothetical protein